MAETPVSVSAANRARPPKGRGAKPPLTNFSTLGHSLDLDTTKERIPRTYKRGVVAITPGEGDAGIFTGAEPGVCP